MENKPKDQIIKQKEHIFNQLGQQPKFTNQPIINIVTEALLIDTIDVTKELMD